MTGAEVWSRRPVSSPHNTFCRDTWAVNMFACCSKNELRVIFIMHFSTSPLTSRYLKMKKNIFSEKKYEKKNICLCSFRKSDSVGYETNCMALGQIHAVQYFLVIFKPLSLPPYPYIQKMYFSLTQILGPECI